MTARRMSYQQYRHMTKNKPSKYKNQPIEIDGHKFPSRKEANRYIQLKLLEKAGKIVSLEIQVPFELQPKFVHNGRTIRAIKYVADFVYFDSRGKMHIEDVKGSEDFTTPEFKLKRKMFIYKYGTDIEIV